MYFTTKTLVIALAAGAVAMPADTPAGGPAALSKPKMDGKSPVGGNATHPKPPPEDTTSPPSPDDKEMDKRDFLGIPFPNITDLLSGLKDNKNIARRGGKEGSAKLPGGPYHGGKNMTKPAGHKHAARGCSESKGRPKIPDGMNMTKPTGLRLRKAKRAGEEGEGKEEEGGDKDESGAEGADGEEGEDEEGEGPPIPGGKNMTKPAGLRLRKATRVMKRADDESVPDDGSNSGDGPDDGSSSGSGDNDASGPLSTSEKGGKEGGDKKEDSPPKTETSGAPKPKKPEGSGAPKPKKPEASGAPKKPEPSGAPKPKKSEGGGEDEGEDGGEGGEPVAAAARKKQPCPPKNGTVAAAGSKHNGTMPHPPGPKTKEGKRNVRGPALPIRFWA
ncbi:hypothetical protein PG989_012192 [Apiospora arundinis]